MNIAFNFDFADLPFPSEIGEWTLCFSRDLKDHVWIENRLIQAFAKEFDDNFVDTFRQLGHVVFKWLALTDAAKNRGDVYKLKTANSKIDFRIGFWSQKFVLLPRPGLERSN